MCIRFETLEIQCLAYYLKSGVKNQLKPFERDQII